MSGRTDEEGMDGTGRRTDGLHDHIYCYGEVYELNRYVELGGQCWKGGEVDVGR